MIQTVALVAHDNLKQELMDWVAWNFEVLAPFRLVCTGTTGKRIAAVIDEKIAENNTLTVRPEIISLKSGPLGGDQQLGAMIAEGKIDLLIFFWDPMFPQPHDVDVKALLRIAVAYNIPTASNRASADFVVSSALMHQDYQRKEPDFSKYINRKLPD